MKHLILISTLLIFFFACCKKKNNNTSTLPLITQNGANTFGCKINGEIYSVTGLYENNPVGCAEGNYISIGLSKSINSSNCNKNINYNDIILYLNSDISVKNYTLSYYGNNQTWIYKRVPSVLYTTDSTNIGELNITRADDIVAGTFWFNAKAQDGSIVNVTDGRFDITKQ